jgi:hypothetical protein
MTSATSGAGKSLSTSRNVITSRVWISASSSGCMVFPSIVTPVFNDHEPGIFINDTSCRILNQEVKGFQVENALLYPRRMIDRIPQYPFLESRDPL